MTNIKFDSPLRRVTALLLALALCVGFLPVRARADNTLVGTSLIPVDGTLVTSATWTTGDNNVNNVTIANGTATLKTSATRNDARSLTLSITVSKENVQMSFTATQSGGSSSLTYTLNGGGSKLLLDAQNTASFTIDLEKGTNTIVWTEKTTNNKAKTATLSNFSIIDKDSLRTVTVEKAGTDESVDLAGTAATVNNGASATVVSGSSVTLGTTDGTYAVFDHWQDADGNTLTLNNSLYTVPDANTTLTAVFKARTMAGVPNWVTAVGTSTAYPWTGSDGTLTSGTLISNNTTTTLYLKFAVEKDSVLAYDYEVSTRNTTGLKVTLGSETRTYSGTYTNSSNGSLVTGNDTWELEAGSYTLTASYNRPSSGNGGDNQVKLKNLALASGDELKTLTVTTAGDDTTFGASAATVTKGGKAWLTDSDVTQSVSVIPNSSVSLKAAVNDATFRFDGWYQGNEKFPDENNYLNETQNITVSDDLNLTAKFAKIQQRSLTVSWDEAGGSVQYSLTGGNNSYTDVQNGVPTDRNEGTFYLRATVSGEIYSFEGWDTDGDDTVDKTENPYQGTLGEDGANITAVFSKNPTYKLSLGADVSGVTVKYATSYNNNNFSGTELTSGSYAEFLEGKTVYVQVTVNDSDKALTSLTVGGSEYRSKLDSRNVFTLTMTKDTEINVTLGTPEEALLGDVTITTQDRWEINNEQWSVGFNQYGNG